MSDIPGMAKSVSIGSCEACGAVFIRLRDRDGIVFAAARLEPETAVTISDALLEQAEALIATRESARNPQDLAAMKCEGCA